MIGKPLQRLVFLHIPKTAGTSFHNVMMQNFKPDDLCPERLRFLDRFPTDKMSSYRLFSGHYFFDQLNRIPGPRQVVTLLRDPRRRLLSLYYFFRAHNWAHVEHCETLGIDSPRLAKELPLRDYLRHTDFAVRLYVDNAITRHLVGLKYIQPDGSMCLPKDEAVGIAIENLRNFAAFSIVENFSAAREHLSAVVGFPLPERLPEENGFAQMAATGILENVEREENFDKETEAEIRRCTEMDNQIYTWAYNAICRR